VLIHCVLIPFDLFNYDYVNFHYVNFQAFARIHLITKVLMESSFKVSLQILVDPVGLTP